MRQMVESGHAFRDQYLKDIKLYAGKRESMITDTSMDTVTPEIWALSQDHQEIINHTRLSFQAVKNVR